MNYFLLTLTLLGLIVSCVTSAEPHYTLVPAGADPYRASVSPDRIVLIPTTTPASSQSIHWRTHADVGVAKAQLARAIDGPGMHRAMKTELSQVTAVYSDNGKAHQHKVTFDQLEPDTLYAYRVQGLGTWSEWFQFKTATAEFSPFSFIYFGDAQNQMKAHVSRVFREALLQRPRASVMVHAGDLVNSRAGNHDNEWGEWFHALGWQGSMVNQIVTPGNHEYIEHGTGPRTLVPQFSAQFSSIRNGPEPLQDTVFYTDYQGVRFISLNSMEALQNEELAKLQAVWLEQVLSTNSGHWTVVTYHHPMFSVSTGRDNPILRQYWLPLFEKHNVDLVLQGHDHVYGRSQNLATGLSGQPQQGGPVYVVSVAGPKMYLNSEQATKKMQRVGEDTQLFQLIDVQSNRLVYQAFTPAGTLYDAFELHKDAQGNKYIQSSQVLPEVRVCSVLLAERVRANRCWNGTEFGLDQEIQQ
ncbi:fibronectin type III domain-containing protein [Alkalimonas amylolytica]|uniref:Purple acid Phosphatase, N-terminal domain n=1 Tax=Alkalimonas amylolytica TaxID=152573 RepID=A0A1H4DZI4_ALKAM|nr:fibronectin type III domain-containing protein [Alkalimonas amylolytica]SEA77909.1 Purple acid Phosphatase, N-terminal domain [Alkalimonas amylolytica]